MPAKKTAVILVEEGKTPRPPSQQQSLTPEQQSFNQLGAKIEQQKQQLEEWQTVMALVQQRIHGKLVPLYEQLTRQHAQLIERLHQASLQYSLTAWESAQLHDLIIELCEQVLRHQSPDEEPIIDQIYQLYLAEKAQLDAIETADGKLQPQQDIWPPFQDFDSDTGRAVFDPDDLAANFELIAQQQEAERQYQKQQRKMARLAHKQQQQAKAQQQVSVPAQKSLKQLYQRLAAILHPDREQDEQQKVTKTQLMQQATEAYKSQDLLGLIQLQATSQLNGHSNLAQLADEQLHLYHLNLLKYSQKLDDEIGQHKAKLANLCGIERVDTITPKAVTRKLKEEAMLLTQHNAMLLQQINALKDAKAIKAFLKQYDR